MFRLSRINHALPKWFYYEERVLLSPRLLYTALARLLSGEGNRIRAQVDGAQDLWPQQARFKCLLKSMCI